MYVVSPSLQGVLTHHYLHDPHHSRETESGVIILSHFIDEGLRLEEMQLLAQGHMPGT